MYLLRVLFLSSCFSLTAVRTILAALIGFMPTRGNGAIGALDHSPEERRRLAQQSLSWQCPHCGVRMADTPPPVASAPAPASPAPAPSKPSASAVPTTPESNLSSSASQHAPFSPLQTPPPSAALSFAAAASASSPALSPLPPPTLPHTPSSSASAATSSSSDLLAVAAELESRSLAEYQRANEADAELRHRRTAAAKAAFLARGTMLDGYASSAAAAASASASSSLSSDTPERRQASAAAAAAAPSAPVPAAAAAAQPRESQLLSIITVFLFIALVVLGVRKATGYWVRY